jgi:hypothetical protein
MKSACRHYVKNRGVRRLSWRSLVWKRIPAWVVLICFLSASMLAVIFGWIVSVTRDGFDSFGLMGKSAVAVAEFPGKILYSTRVLLSERDAGFVTQRTVAHTSDYQPISMKSGIDVEGIVVKGDAAALQRSRGWRYLAGVFTIDGKAQNGVLVVSPEFEIARAWALEEGEVPGQKTQPENHKFIHGFSVLRDGSMLFTYDGGMSIQRVDNCGKRMWVTAGTFNHTISPDEEERFAWSIIGFLGKVEIVQVSITDGAIARRISMGQIIDANPSIDILGVRRKDEEIFGGGPMYENNKWEYDRFHINDVEPLPASFVRQFEAFSEGDLLISARSLNLIFVLDPKALKVKWWRSGATRRQHDPDWGATGEISIYDNRMGQQYSRIISIEPKSYLSRVLFDGSAQNFYSVALGKHQVTTVGNLLITSPEQGRVFEVDGEGRLVFDLLNEKPGSHALNYRVSEAAWFPPSAYSSLHASSCN